MENLGFNRVVGSPDDARELSDAFRRASETPIDRLNPPLSPEKTEREQDVVEKTVAAVDRVTQMYGADSRPVNADRVALTAPGGVEAITDGDIRNGVAFYVPHLAVIDRQTSDLALAHLVAHEAVHLRGYKSAAALPDGRDRALRTGINPGSGRDQVYSLNEAVTDELAEIAVAAIDDAAIAEEQNAQLRLRELTLAALASREKRDRRDEAEAAVTLFPDARRLLDGYDQSTGDDRDRFGALLDTLRSKSGEIRALNPQTKNRLAFASLRRKITEKTGERDADVFGRFARAYFGSDSYADLVRYVERTLGPGSFRNWKNSSA